MPRETIRSVGPNETEAKVGWSRDSEYVTLVTEAEENLCQNCLHVHQFGAIEGPPPNTLSYHVISSTSGPVTYTGTSTSTNSAMTTHLGDLGCSREGCNCRDYKRAFGWWVNLDRMKINELIRVLRKARDQAYGRDE